MQPRCISNLRDPTSFRFGEHQQRSEGVDIVMLPIDLAGLSPVNPVDLGAIEVPFRSVAGDDVAIVGYPFRDPPLDGPLPVWRRGGVATEPAWAYEPGLPYYFVDGAGGPGMSGSPVYEAEIVPGFEVSPDVAAAMERLHAGETEGDESEILRSTADWRSTTVTDYRLIGVYAGRTGLPDDAPQSLGRVWHVQAVLDLLEDAVEAGHPYPE
ncbi:trypsin-like peptidase domain-containing protein [Desertimonas flava]|uniref:trypsin-like peptidase domain-containing protein n=1 Tax=Desertimonas flava TaxID=2064846 RepID=UPI0013C51128|nr:trypsin-like peptidase domain-containing protein [Desertimonas flava]